MHLATQLKETVETRPVAASAAHRGALLRLLTCGSVDDGKSTLIGRLLWDGAGVTEDQAAAVCTPRIIARSMARRSISACCSTGSRPSASRASPSTSPGAISRRRTGASSSSIPRATSNTPATWRPAPATPTSPFCWSMPATAPSARPAAMPRSAIWSASRRWCSPSTRWMRSTGRKRATARSSKISAPWPGASISRKSPSSRWRR